MTNTYEIVGDEALEDGLLEKTLTELVDDRIKMVGNSAFYEQVNLVKLVLPNVTSIDTQGVGYCTSLVDVQVPNLTEPGMYAFSYSSSLKILDLPKATKIGTWSLMGCEGLTALVLRREDAFCPLGNVAALNGTPIASGTGYIYVPRALLDNYKVATHWRTYANQFRALEDYTVDGTVTGELDTNYLGDTIVEDGLAFSIDLRGRTAENDAANPPTIVDSVSGLACTTHNIDWDGETSGFVDNGLLLKDYSLITSPNQYKEATYSVLGVPPLPDVDFTNGITLECCANTEGVSLLRFYDGMSNGTTRYLPIYPGSISSYAQAYIDTSGADIAATYLTHHSFAELYSNTGYNTGEHLYAFTYSPEGILSCYLDGVLLGQKDFNINGDFGRFCLPDVLQTMKACYIGSMDNGTKDRRMVIGSYRTYNRVLSAHEIKNNYRYEASKMVAGA